MTLTLAEVVGVLDDLYDPATAQEWDAVGLVTGDLDQPVRRVLFAVDPVQAVIDEAIEGRVDLLVTHHPLLLRGVDRVATTEPKGRAVTALIKAGIALHVAHTNADVASPGVSDALAAALGVNDVVALRPVATPALDKLVTFVPHTDADRVVDALAAAGAGSVGDYERCAWTVRGEGTFVPRAGATPAVGSVDAREDVPETRVEMVLARSVRSAVVTALRSAHPYEEPAFDLVALEPLSGPRGTGRVGRLAAPITLRDFADLVAERLPATSAGVRVAGDPDRTVETVAVCGGAGDDLFAEVRASGADVYLTADLRHHPASEALAHGGPALLDCAHWATEWPWLADAERLLLSGLGERAVAAGQAATVETAVSRLVTDPWTTRRDTPDPRSTH